MLNASPPSPSLSSSHIGAALSPIYIFLYVEGFKKFNLLLFLLLDLFEPKHGTISFFLVLLLFPPGQNFLILIPGFSFLNRLVGSCPLVGLTRQRCGRTFDNNHFYEEVVYKHYMYRILLIITNITTTYKKKSIKIIQNTFDNDHNIQEEVYKDCTILLIITITTISTKKFINIIQDTFDYNHNS